MTQLAVKAYFQQVIQAGIDRPIPVAVHRQRPKQETIGDQSVVIIWIRKSPEKRLTMPRGAGSKCVDHTVLVMIWFSADDAESGGDNFDVLKQQVLTVLRTLPTPVTITDPMTGEESTLAFVSENIIPEDVEPMEDIERDGLIIYSAVISFPAEEIVRG